jgi:hypothetical protein
MTRCFSLVMLIIIVTFIGCSDDRPEVETDFTGNEKIYALEAGSVYPISGTATFKEKKDGTTVVIIALTGTDGVASHPVHLHMGDIATPDANVAALLNSISAETGLSETSISRLADETPMTFNQLTSLTACIKIHLAASGPDRDIILAGGNIGNTNNGRLSANQIVAVCKSN